MSYATSRSMSLLPGHVRGEVAPKMPGKDGHLQHRQRPPLDVATKELVVHLVLPVRLEESEELRSPVVSEIPATTGALVKVLQPQLSPADRTGDKPIDDRRPELLEDVQCQGRTTASDPVEEPDLGIEAYRVRRSDKLRCEDAVAEAQRGVRRIRRRASRSPA